MRQCKGFDLFWCCMMGWQSQVEWWLVINCIGPKPPSTLEDTIWISLRLSNLKQKKNQNGPLKKTEFFNSDNSQYFFVKISWSSPWVSRIHWCEGHWYGSTYMAVRLSDISSKTGQKCIFCVFWPFLSLCRTASRPYRLSHTNALRINEFY